VGQWIQFFIVDKPYKNMLNPLNGKNAWEEKEVFRQTGMELHYPGSRKPPASSGRMNAPTFGRDVAPLGR